jgi:hypothetical protein|tara:strand:- start:15331 stop:15564 length:234 start_codon:yes stop_codon:yes gene_type:complete
MPAAAATDRALARTAVEVRAANPPRRASEARTDANERVREAMSASHNDVGGAQNLIAKKRSRLQKWTFLPNFWKTVS